MLSDDAIFCEKILSNTFIKGLEGMLFTDQLGEWEIFQDPPSDLRFEKPFVFEHHILNLSQYHELDIWVHTLLQ